MPSLLNSPVRLPACSVSPNQSNPRIFVFQLFLAALPGFSHWSGEGEGRFIRRKVSVSHQPSLKVPAETFPWARVTPSPGGPSPAVEASPTLGRWSGAQAGTQSNQFIVALVSWFSPIRSAPTAQTVAVKVINNFHNIVYQVPYSQEIKFHVPISQVLQRDV